MIRLRCLLWIPSLSMLGLLAACSASPPTHYYTLQTMVAAGTSAQLAPGAMSAPPLRVEPVAIPPELDRLELVVRSGKFRVQIADSERWAAPLDDQIRQVLSGDLASRLGPSTIADFNEPASDQPRRLLSIAIHEFYADETCAVTLRAAWTLKTPGKDLERGREEVQEPAVSPCDPAAIPAAMSNALGVLTDRLVTSMQSPATAAGGG